MDEPDGFREFVASRSRALLRSAQLLTGDERLAEDLVQSALERTWPRWHRLERAEAAEAYVRKVMLSIYLTWGRRRWRGELPFGDVPEQIDARDDLGATDLRTTVHVVLAGLPRRQRAVVVLRYFDDLTEEQTAAALGCSVGTVKSQASRALAKLRISALASLFDEEVTP